MSFIWNGVSSDTMKFNVTSRQVYNAPAYDLNAIEVPGRSGDLLNPQNRFKNKQVTYTGFLKASDFEGSTWREKLSTGLIQLKGWLCSDAGAYHELTDDYDPGFTRYGYISGEMAISDIEDRPFGVTLTVTFNCKPFMYKAGEPMELPETKSASGSIITITDGAENTPLKSAVVNIEPVQDLHGYDNPWPAGGGKNKLVPALVNGSIAWNGVTLSVQNGELYLSGKATESGGRTSIRTASFTLPAGSYIISCVTTQFVLHDTSGNILANTLGTTTFTLAEATSVYAGFNVVDGTTYSGVLKAQIESGSTATSYEPYSNICPISGWSEVEINHSDADTSDPETVTVSLGQTVYGGTLDVVRGSGLKTMGKVTLNGTENWQKHGVLAGWFYVDDLLSDAYTDGYASGFAISSAYKQIRYSLIGSAENGEFGIGIPTGGSFIRLVIKDTAYSTAAEFKAALSSQNVDVVYRLASPTTLSLTPQTIKTLLGVNNIWADAGSMEIEYPIPTENPYPFGSRPLYEITMAGTGTLVVNGKEWTITDYTGTLYCDTETMDWYDASQLRNNIVSGDGWPVFEAGENSISYTGDITKVMVTPRWRTL